VHAKNPKRGPKNAPLHGFLPNLVPLSSYSYVDKKISIYNRKMSRYTRMSKEKVKVGFSISESLFQSFRQFLAEKYGEVRKGLISAEVECALAAYMADHRTHTQNTQTTFDKPKAPNPTPLVQRVREDIKDYMTGHFGYEVIYQVPMKHVMEAIAMVRGSDPRTIRKWLKAFERYHLMRIVGTNIVEFL